MEHKAKEKKVKEYFRGTEVGLMIEVFQDQLKMVAEDLSGFRDETKKRLDKIEKNQEVTLEYLYRIDEEISDIKKKLKKFDESNVGKKDFESVKARVFDCETRLKFAEKQLKISAA